MFLEFFDEVYVINLPERADRLVVISDELQGHGIPFTKFVATKHENGVKGLVESMKRLFSESLAKKQSNIMVLEDDASFLVPEPVEFIRQVLQQLPKDYHLLELGLNLLTRPKRISDNLLKVMDCYSTHAICYSAEGMRFALERLCAVPVMPYDQFVRNEILCCGKTYCTYPMLATQREGFSSIENKRIDWGKLMATTYAMMTRNL
jgi:GR25 family glycosyltransferase involved in LPS biosynthesis